MNNSAIVNDVISNYQIENNMSLYFPSLKYVVFNI